MNYDQYIERLKDLAAFSGWVSLLVVPALAAIKSRVENLKGWMTLLVAFVMACLIVGGLTQPNSLQATVDSLLIGFAAAVIAVGGDSYLFRVVGKVKGPPKLPETIVDSETEKASERPTVPPSELGIDAFDKLEVPTKPMIKLDKE